MASWEIWESLEDQLESESRTNTSALRKLYDTILEPLFTLQVKYVAEVKELKRTMDEINTEKSILNHIRNTSPRKPDTFDYNSVYIPYFNDPPVNEDWTSEGNQQITAVKRMQDCVAIAEVTEAESLPQPLQYIVELVDGETRIREISPEHSLANNNSPGDSPVSADLTADDECQSVMETDAPMSLLERITNKLMSSYIHPEDELVCLTVLDLELAKIEASNEYDMLE